MIQIEKKEKIREKREKRRAVSRTWIKFFLLFSLLISNFSFVSAQDFLYNRRGDDLTIKVSVIGPGDELYFWWGHIGLVVQDNITGQAFFFDWGVFSFDNDNFFLDFAFGRPIYSCMVSTIESSFNVYRRTNRDIILYTLDIPAERKEAVLQFAENNMLPENRDYRYHHFDDNCATRIRDIIDYALEGQFKAKYGNMPSRFTLRQHVMRHTWFNPFIDWILNFWMGQVIDRPITVWDDMFLPSEIGKLINEFHYIGPDGRERQLVSSVEIVNSSVSRPIVLDEPRLQWPVNLLATLIFAIILVFLYYRTGETKAFRVFLGLLQSLFGIIFGIAGSMLFFMMIFTDHDYTFQNSNIIFVNPIFLALVPLGIILAYSRNEKKLYNSVKYSKVLWVYVFFGGLITSIIKHFPIFYQQNQVTQVMVIPLALVMFFLLTRLGKRLGKVGFTRL